MAERILTKNKKCSSFLVGKSDQAMNADGDVFAFKAFINAGDRFQLGDGVLYDRISYEITEFKGKSKNLTLLHAKRLK